MERGRYKRVGLWDKKGEGLKNRLDLTDKVGFRSGNTENWQEYRLREGKIVLGKEEDQIGLDAG